MTRTREGIRLAVQFLAGSGSGEMALLRTADRISDWLAECPPEVRPDGTADGVFETIINNEEIIMSALTDLQAADAALQAEVAQAISDWTAQLTAAGGDQAAIEAVVTDMNNQVAALKTQDAAEGGTPAPSGGGTPPPSSATPPPAS